MAEKKVVIKNKTGLHARPAALFVQKAANFPVISITLGDKEVNAKSIMGVMSLGAGPGSEILIKAEGEDAQQAVDTLAEIIASFSD